MKKKRVLIIDALNMYFRAYIVDPSLSSHGHPIGGTKGFLKILNKLVRETTPDQIVICWDGPGGSQKRKAANKNYKQGRTPIRLNRAIRNLSPEEELANKIWQQTRLFEYLNEMPVVQFIFEHVEADDVISYVQSLPILHGAEKVIVSSDKDFFQLLSDDTVLYRPVRKEVLNSKRVVDKFGIHPLNFALARAMVGDKSDNLKGVGGVGLATVAKRFPFLKENRSCTLDEVLKCCETSDSSAKCFSNILEKREIVESNYHLMQLYAPAMSPQAKETVRYAFKNYEPSLNKTEVRKMFVQDGIGELYLNDLFVNFKKTIVDWKEKTKNKIKT